MHIQELLEKLHTIAVDNPTARVSILADTIDSEETLNSLPVDSVVYSSGTNTVLIS